MGKKMLLLYLISIILGLVSFSYISQFVEKEIYQQIILWGGTGIILLIEYIVFKYKSKEDVEEDISEDIDLNIKKDDNKKISEWNNYFKPYGKKLVDINQIEKSSNFWKVLSILLLFVILFSVSGFLYLTYDGKYQPITNLVCEKQETTLNCPEIPDLNCPAVSCPTPIVNFNPNFNVSVNIP